MSNQKVPGPRDQLARLIDESTTHDARVDIAPLADAILDAGWRPLLPEGASPWEAYVAAYREFQETDPHAATAHPTAHHMHALDAALRVYDPCAEHGDLLGRYVAASLEFDYLAEGDCGRDHEDDTAEHEAAIANIAEMHRLLNVRAERLAEAHEKLRVDIANLSAVRDELARQRDDHRARADAAEAKLAEIRARFAEVDDKAIFSDEAFGHIRAIVGEVQR